MLQFLTGPAVLLQGSWESPKLLSSGSCPMNMVDSAKISILTIEYGFYIRLIKAIWIWIPTHLKTCLNWIPCAKVIRVICMQRHSQTRHSGLFIFNPKTDLQRLLGQYCMLILQINSISIINLDCSSLMRDDLNCWGWEGVWGLNLSQ